MFNHLIEKKIKIFKDLDFVANVGSVALVVIPFKFFKYF